VVTYEPFGIYVDKYMIRYQGTVDLNTRMADLRTEIPLAALGGTFKELQGYVDNVSIPFVARGSIDEKLESEIDPNFDLGAAVGAAGIGGALKELLGDTEKDGSGDGGLGGLLDPSGGSASEGEAEAPKKPRRKKRRKKKDEGDGGG